MLRGSRAASAFARGPRFPEAFFAIHRGPPGSQNDDAMVKGRMARHPGAIQTEHKYDIATTRPSGFSQHVTGLEYGPVILSGEEMFLPVRATETARDGKRLLRNEITFQDCRKFSANSKVTFGPEQR